MLTSGPGAGACMVEHLDGVRDGGSPVVAWWHARPGLSHAKAPVFNEDDSGMSHAASQAAADAAVARLPRSHKVLVRLIDSFPHRTVVEWRVVLTPRRPSGSDATDTGHRSGGEARESEAAQDELARLQAMTDAVAEEVGAPAPHRGSATAGQ